MTHLSDCRRCLRLFQLAFTACLIAGCRPAPPAEFTPSDEVRALTDDIDDPEELKTYVELQKDIRKVLAERCGTAGNVRLLGRETADPDRLRHGYELFTRYCVQCHGVNGDGRGELSVHLKPRPRDYTLGIFKFISTKNGKPRKADLIRTVRRGVPGTSMPSFKELSNDDLSDVVDYVLALTYRGELQRVLAEAAYSDEELPDKEDVDAIVAENLKAYQEANRSVVTPVTAMPEMTPESIAKGRELYLKFACSRCHGNDGRGQLLSNADAGVDAWGQKGPAADLTSGMFHGGGKPIDIYRRIYAGISGTPMPSFATQFENEPEVIWNLVHFIEDTGQRRRFRRPMLDSGGAAALSTTPGALRADAPEAEEQ